MLKYKREVDNRASVPFRKPSMRHILELRKAKKNKKKEAKCEHSKASK